MLGLLLLGGGLVLLLTLGRSSGAPAPGPGPGPAPGPGPGPGPGPQPGPNDKPNKVPPAPVPRPGPDPGKRAFAEIDPIFAQYVFAFSSMNPDDVRVVAWWAIVQDSVPRTAGLDAWVLTLESAEDMALGIYADAVSTTSPDLLNTSAEQMRSRGFEQAAAQLDALAVVVGLNDTSTPEELETARVLVRELAEQGVVPLAEGETLQGPNVGEVFRELYEWTGRKWHLSETWIGTDQPNAPPLPPLVAQFSQASEPGPPWAFAREWFRPYGGRWEIREERWNY